VQLSWDAVSGASGYNLYYSPGGDKVNSAAISSTTYLDIGLTNDEEYCYQVTAIKGARRA